MNYHEHQNRTIRRVLVGTVLAITGLLSNGCTSLGHGMKNPELDGAELPPLSLPDELTTISPIAEIPVDPGLLVARRQNAGNGEPLPQLWIKKLHVSGGTTEDIFRLLLDGTSIAVSLDRDAAQQTGYVGTQVSGPLAVLVEDIANRLGVWWRYEKGILRLSTMERFLVEVPPFLSATLNAKTNAGGDDSRSSSGGDTGMGRTQTVSQDLLDMLTHLGGQNVVYDAGVGILTYQANRRAQEAISGYLEALRRRPLIVYDAFVWEIQLNDTHRFGVQWNKFGAEASKGGVNLSGGAGPVENMLGLNAVYEAGSFRLDTLFSFLSTQGTVRAIAQPQLTIVSGQMGNFEVTTTERIIAQMGASMGSGYSTTTTETEDMDTGMKIRIHGMVSGGTVHTRVVFEQSEKVGERTAEIGDTTIYLPTRSSRQIETTTVARPGDAIRISGLMLERQFKTQSGIPMMEDSLMLSGSEAGVQRSELVILLRPRLIRFIESGAFDAGSIAEPARVAPGMAESKEQ